MAHPTPQGLTIKQHEKLDALAELDPEPKVIGLRHSNSGGEMPIIAMPPDEPGGPQIIRTLNRRGGISR